MQIACGLCLLTATLSCVAAGAQGPVVLGNGSTRVRAWVESGRLHEQYQSAVAGQWVTVATDLDPATEGPSTLIGADSGMAQGGGPTASIVGERLVEEFRAAGMHVTREVNLVGQWFKVSTNLMPAPDIKIHSFFDRFKFVGRPDWCFAPSVGGFVPDAQYKAPVILVQEGRAALGIVADVAALDLDTLKRCNHSLDLDVPGGPVLSVGFVPARLAYHSVYAPDKNRTWVCGTRLANSYYLLVTADAEPGEAYREAVRMLWSQFGRPTQLAAAAQQVGTVTSSKPYEWLERIRPVEKQKALDKRLQGLALWDDWRSEVWGEQTLQDWLLLPLEGGATGGGVRTIRWGPGPSIYLSAWFNTLRTSYGMALYARRIGDQDLLRKARQTVEVALRAPGRDGAFKCIGVPAVDGKSAVWAAGDGSGDSTKEGYLGYDMSWTGYWLLRWRSANLPESEAILPRCRGLAKFLCDRQSGDGMLPTRFSEDGSADLELSRKVKAETGPVALFLLELYAQDPDPRWLDAGRRGVAFLERSVIPDRQWYDFETFWSCSPRKAMFDERSQQWPANDLALGQSVAAFLSAYRVTHELAYLAQGERLLDYLLLYQQCWTNPMLQGLTGPAMLLGGFTTQNSDAEWS
ncbi:MAG TPA: hypothetical protein VII43_02140, partial [Opitutaceae bacterium]